jgi:pSer/pThr/pTyr-binding forkhead associated (FHA) protein
MDYPNPTPGLPISTPADVGEPSHPEPQPFVPLRLAVQPGGGGVELTRPEMVFGRHSDADVRLHLPDVSRRHCRFVFSDGQWKVFDLQSTNGVYVNEQRTEHAVLHHRDLIRIGGYTFEVNLGEGPVPDARKTVPTIAGVLPDALPDGAPRRKAS